MLCDLGCLVGPCTHTTYNDTTLPSAPKVFLRSTAVCTILSHYANAIMSRLGEEGAKNHNIVQIVHQATTQTGSSRYTLTACTVVSDRGIFPSNATYKCSSRRMGLNILSAWVPWLSRSRTNLSRGQTNAKQGIRKRCVRACQRLNNSSVNVVDSVVDGQRTRISVRWG